jgi:phosphoribosylamine--glycine ligase
MAKVAEPLIKGVREKYGILYRGILYLGLMLVEHGPEVIPYVLEINIRLGDPEAQVILPRLKTDLVDVSEAVLTGRLDKITLEWDPNYRVCLIATSGPTKGKKGWYKGYPDRYKIGLPIEGVDRIDEDCLVFHSGTEADSSGRLLTTGGRVLCIVSSGTTLKEARQVALSEMEKVRFEGIYYRKDIGLE